MENCSYIWTLHRSKPNRKLYSHVYSPEKLLFHSSIPCLTRLLACRFIFIFFTIYYFLSKSKEILIYEDQINAFIFFRLY